MLIDSVKMWQCKYCNKMFDYTRPTDMANHTRHCDNNPKKFESYKNIKVKAKQRATENLGNLKYFQVLCQSCNKSFTVREREKQFPKKEKYFCSRSCSNSTGGKAKANKYHYDEIATYSTVAWRHHQRKCLVCGEERVVAAHHLNEVHSDNRPENLVPLCPTHHMYMHSKHKVVIEHLVNEYVKNKWGISSPG